MPYCPKCDMEFVEGITVCSDCGGPLVESEEIYKKRKMEEDALKKEVERPEDFREISRESDRPENEDFLKNWGKKSAVHPGVYVDAAQRYEDRKSSASAFYIIGAVITIFSAICWAGIVPLALMVRIVLTIIGIGSLIIGFKTQKEAKALAPEIEKEKERTQSIIQWFVSSYTGEELDGRIRSEHSDLSPEELSLKRYELIQDLLVTNHDLPDPVYVDALTEEIYGKLYGRD